MIARLSLLIVTALLVIIISKDYRVKHTTQVRLNPRPVIGILTQPHRSGPPNSHYIAASYVNWVEAAGARSIAIPQNADNATIDAIFSSINGVLLTGGDDVELPDSVKRLWDLAVQQNDAGNIFPIWATCLGYEMIVALVGAKTKDEQKNLSILYKNYTSENIALPLHFTRHAQKSRVFSDPNMRRIAETMNVTMNNHMNGITPLNFLKNKRLSDTFRILSTNVDRNNQPFVSTIEAINYPFIGVQWHPEKNNFEYNTIDGTDTPVENIPHFSEAIRFSLDMSLFFVDMARANPHTYYPMDEFPPIWKYPRKFKKTFQETYEIDVSRWNHEEVAIIPDSDSDVELSDSL